MAESGNLDGKSEKRMPHMLCRTSTHALAHNADIGLRRVATP